jgi:uncharacterized protein (TIGR02145 family)
MPRRPGRRLAIAFGVALGLSAASCIMHSFTRMPDGKQWTTENLHANIQSSYCYEDSESKCREYGRLYTWESAHQACRALGHAWRLPSEDEWRQLAKSVGGIADDSTDQGHRAYTALMIGGGSGFNARLGGGRSEDGQYARAGAHGFYWTATEHDAATATFFNVAQGAQAIYRQAEGEKGRAFSVRCVRE